MTRLVRLVLDVLKPHQPSILELGGTLGALPGVARVEIRVDELDKRTESLRVEVSGSDVVYDAVAEAIRRLGGAVHSIDEAVFVDPEDG